MNHPRKWGISFDGVPRGMPIAEFISRIEHLQMAYQDTWEEVLRSFHCLVDGQAKEWFWMHVCTRGLRDCPNFKNALQQRFQTLRSNIELQRELRERKQRPGGSVDEYL